MSLEFRKGSELEFLIEKLAFGGKGLGRVDGMVVFTDRTIPGQKVRARITRKKRHFAEARVVDLLQQSPHRVEPPCPHFGVCGGCSWQDIDYVQQLFWKRQHVIESLEHLAGVKSTMVQETQASPRQTHYRNKMEFTFSPRRWHEVPPRLLEPGQNLEQLALGLHVRGFFDAVLNVSCCFLGPPTFSDILSETRRWCQRSGLAAYSTRNHEGFWRFLVVRESSGTGRILLHIITSSQGDPRLVEQLSVHLTEMFPTVSTIVHSINDGKAQVAVGQVSRTLVGPGYIEEQLGRLRFRISAESFFQTNTLGAERLYETILQLGNFTGKESVWDLYCGTGSIALYIASRVRQVTGFELNLHAIEDARQNCRLNGIHNCSFHAGDVKDMIGSWPVSHQTPPDVVIADPPRSGMHPRVLKALSDLAPQTIIAVSCNPATLARDLSLLLEGYRIDAVIPFDMFPHTPHIECVVKMTKGKQPHHNP